MGFWNFLEKVGKDRFWKFMGKFLVNNENVYENKYYFLMEYSLKN